MLKKKRWNRKYICVKWWECKISLRTGSTQRTQLRWKKKARQGWQQIIKKFSIPVERLKSIETQKKRKPHNIRTEIK